MKYYLIFIIFVFSCQRTHKRDFWLNISAKSNLNNIDSFSSKNNGIFEYPMVLEDKGTIINDVDYYQVKNLFFDKDINGQICRDENSIYFTPNRNDKRYLLFQLNACIGEQWYIPYNQFLQLKITYEGSFIYHNETLYSFSVLSCHDSIVNKLQWYKTVYLSKNEIMFIKFCGQMQRCYLIDYNDKNITLRTTHLNYPEPWEFCLETYKRTYKELNGIEVIVTDTLKQEFKKMYKWPILR